MKWPAATAIAAAMLVAMTYPGAVSALEDVPDLVVAEMERLEVRLVDEPAKRGLSFELKKGPDGAHVTTDGVFWWTPTEEQGPGNYQVQVEVNDEGGGSSVFSFTIWVLEVNRPVVAGYIADQSVNQLSEIALMATADDPDLPKNPLRWALESGPRGANIHPSGKFRWTPDGAQGPGLYGVTLQVTDGEFVDEVSFGITVLGDPSVTTTTTTTTTIPPWTTTTTVPPSTTTTTDPPSTTTTSTSVPATSSTTTTSAAPPESTTTTAPAPDWSTPPAATSGGIPAVTPAMTPAERKEAVVMTAQAVEMMVEGPIESATVVRTFVVMGSVATKAVRSMGAPILLFVALGLAVATVGNVTVFPLLGRTRRLTGVVSRFDDESGHGFVVGDADGKTVFVHGETLRRRYRRLNPGQRVSYRLIKGSRRDFAVSLTVLEEG